MLYEDSSQSLQFSPAIYRHSTSELLASLNSTQWLKRDVSFLTLLVRVLGGWFSVPQETPKFRLDFVPIVQSLFPSCGHLVRLLETCSCVQGSDSSQVLREPPLGLTCGKLGLGECRTEAPSPRLKKSLPAE